MGLDKTQIVNAAIEQIDQRGLAAFSMRELARTLGVSPAVIYWHVGGRQEDLFAEVSAVITAALTDEIEPEQSWQDRLRSVFRRYRYLVHQHPKVAPLLGAQMKSNGVANLVWVETVLAALAEAGFEGESLRDAFNVLIGGLSGFVTMELAPPPDDADGWQQTFADRVANIDADSFPHTHAVLPLISNRIFVLRWQNGADVSYDSSFEMLLDIIIDGLTLRSQQQGVSRR
ncbi:TetR/AcrR family transcriptional regulator [Marinobacterium lutimaris]|uniref:Transcriptional regulator, TetR family n=1 Tax=Marinobacterium lutimaris TaxID=568106 RepID=A0A1H6C913_9GAMM|nr:TetR family transcriptional regulator [Marinobacterium lutimaris]SEG69115.1 transcriptional regulator, TetR family [Marinobacterium lutimaris]